MDLDNFPEIRIEYYENKGYSVEIQKTKWYGKKYWTHIIEYPLISTKPFYYINYDLALKIAVNYLIYNSK